MSQPRKRSDGNVMYIYDRVCTKSAKKREIVQMRTNAGERARRGYGRRNEHNDNFAKTQIIGTDRMNRRGRTQSDDGSAHGRGTYVNPGNPCPRGKNTGTDRGSGERVRETPFKLVLEKIINMTDSIEERGKVDEDIARRRAVVTKKFAEYKHAVGTAVLLVLISLFFVVFMYKLFFVVKDIKVEGSDVYDVEEIIRASGIEAGDNLYSFSSAEVKRRISFYCPYIKSAEITRKMPQSVTIKVEDDAPVFYANIWGDTLKLSAGLRVLGKTEGDGLDGLVELVLPLVDSSVVGDIVQFTEERQQRFIRSTLSTVLESGLMKEGMIDKIYLSDEYAIKMTSGGRYLLNIGNDTELDLKLRMGYKTLVSENINKNSMASIDLSIVGEACVFYDPKLNFD